MWTIGEVKREGWSRIKAYYWPAFLVSLIAGILGADGGGFGSSFGGSIGSSSSGSGSNHDYLGNSSYVPEAAMIFLGVMIVVLIVVFIIALAFRILVGNPMLVGKNRYYMESRFRGKSAGIGTAFWAFSCGHYLNIVKIMFLRDLYISLWTLLLIIPGVIKSYEYAMIPYILSENPEASKADVFALTKDMMTDNKFQFFCFELSFIGWILLGLLACCIGVIFVNPYFEASQAEVYVRLRRGIGSFPFNGYGVPEEPNVYQQVYENVNNGY